MRRLTLYVLKQMTASLVVAVLLLAGLIWILQVMRLGHHLLGGQAEVLGRLLLYSLPTLLTLTLPLGLAAAVLHTLGQLAGTGELDAMRTFGLSPLQLALPGGLLTLGAAGAALWSAQIEGPALQALQRTATRAMARSLAAGLRPGQFHRLPGDTVLFMERRLQRGRVAGLMIARGETQLLTAREASFAFINAPDPGLSLRLEHGELHLGDGRGGLTRVRFGEMEQTLDLGRAVGRHFGFLGRRASGGAGAGAASLALGVLATVIGLTVRRRALMAAAGLGACVAAQLGCWIAGGPALALAITGLSLGVLLWINRGGVRRAGD